MKRGYVDVPEGQVHYRAEGNGEVIVLLHMAGSSSDEYSKVIPYLSRTHRVVAPDYLGCGDSDPAPRPYEVEDHVRTMIKAIDALGIKKASFAGHHVGAEVVVELALSCPERMDKIVLSSLPYFRDEQERTAYVSKPHFNPVHIRPDGSHLMEWWQRSARYGDAPDIVDARVLDFHKAGARGEELHDAAFKYATKLPQKLPLIKCPTLMISATRDHWYPVQPIVKGLIPRSRITLIENAPVYVDRTMPGEFAGAILDFLKNPQV